ADSAATSAKSGSPAARRRCARSRFRSASASFRSASSRSRLIRRTVSLCRSSQPASSLVELMFVSHDPNLGLLAHGRKERRPLLNSPAQVLFGPYDCVELAAEIRLELLYCRDQRVGFDIADDEHVDVAPGVVVAAGIGTEYESEPNALVSIEEHSELRHDPDGARV